MKGEKAAALCSARDEEYNAALPHTRDHSPLHLIGVLPVALTETKFAFFRCEIYLVVLRDYRLRLPITVPSYCFPEP